MGEPGFCRDKMLKDARWNLEHSSEEMWNATTGYIGRILQAVLEESRAM